MSQAVISQWLSSKYHGNVEKVDEALRAWLLLRKSGRTVQHSAHAASSVLRVRRDNAATIGELEARRRLKEANKRRKMAKYGVENEGLILRNLTS